MDFMPLSISELLKKQRPTKQPIDPIERKLITFQLFKALLYFKSKKVCHRDLKPPNILYNPETSLIRICDFGSAKILNKSQKNVAYICSRYYRAPQLILGSTDYGTEIDVWSIGCIIAEFLTCEPIFPGDSTNEQLIEIVKVLGTPLPKHLKQYEQVNKVELKIPKIPPNDWSRVFRKYKPEPEMVDLISKLLVYDTQLRLKPEEALLHPYLTSLASETKFTQSIPSLFKFKGYYDLPESVLDQLEIAYQNKQSLQLKNNENFDVVTQGVNTNSTSKAESNEDAKDSNSPSPPLKKGDNQPEDKTQKVDSTLKTESLAVQAK